MPEGARTISPSCRVRSRLLLRLAVDHQHGVNLQLMPAKGMTLPFISYGGSSMIARLLAFLRSKCR
jgi:hypothetical protein